MLLHITLDIQNLKKDKKETDGLRKQYEPNKGKEKE